MTRAVFVNPKDCTIEEVEYSKTDNLLVKVITFIGTSDLEHLFPIPTTGGIMCGVFCDEWGMSRQEYAFIIKGYAQPIMGPACFYAEIITRNIDGEPDQVNYDFPYKLEPGVNLQWLMKNHEQEMLIRRPKDHTPPTNPKSKMH